MLTPLLCSILDLTRWLTVTPVQPTSQGPQSSTMLAHSVGPGVSLGASPPPLTLTTSSSYTISGAHKPMAPSDVSIPGISPSNFRSHGLFGTPLACQYSNCVYKGDPHISSEPHCSSDQLPTLCHAQCRLPPLSMHKVLMRHLDPPTELTAPHSRAGSAVSSAPSPASHSFPLPADPPTAHDLPPPQDWVQMPPPNKAALTMYGCVSPTSYLKILTYRNCERIVKLYHPSPRFSNCPHFSLSACYLLPVLCLSSSHLPG